VHRADTGQTILAWETVVEDHTIEFMLLADLKRLLSAFRLRTLADKSGSLYGARDLLAVSFIVISDQNSKGMTFHLKPESCRNAHGISTIRQ
jgi:hypothetical protein